MKIKSKLNRNVFIIFFISSILFSCENKSADDKSTEIIGDKKTSTNLRYKTGKNLNFQDKNIFEIKKPKEAHLPISNLSSSYVFASNNHFFAYPNKYNYYVQYYKNTFQHGGISLEEMLIPAIILESKG